jgi:hypothetical protein
VHFGSSAKWRCTVVTHSNPSLRVLKLPWDLWLLVFLTLSRYIIRDISLADWIVQCSGLESPRPSRVQFPGWPSKMLRIVSLADESLGLSNGRCVLRSFASHKRVVKTSLNYVYLQRNKFLRQLFEMLYAWTSSYSQTKIETSTINGTAPRKALN